jgi:hypothetical protein
MRYHIVMKLKNLLSNWDAGKMLILKIVVAVAAMVASICYGPVGFTNPFYLICCYLTVRVLIAIFTYDFEDSHDPEFKKNLVFGPLHVLTAALIVGFAIPDHFVVRILVVGIAGWFLLSGLKSCASASIPLWEKTQNRWEKTTDQWSFRKHMKKVAQTARIEQELSSDLAGFLKGTDSAGAGK